VQNYQNPVYPSFLGGASLSRGAAMTLAPSARLSLGLIILLALGLRLWGVSFGLPYVIQPDEPSVEMRALHMWLAGDPNPHYYVYPSLYYDLQALWAFLAAHAAGLFSPDLLRHPLQHLPFFYLSGRVLTAALGTATVAVTYLAGRVLSPRLGLIAALFLAVAAQHVQQSHYITVDAPTALFTALTALWALRALREGGRLRDVLLAGLCAGLAAGTKYNAGVALALPLAAALLARGRPWGWRLGAVVAAMAAAALAFLLTTPFALLDPAPLLRSLHVIARHYSSGHPGAEGNNNALWYLSYLWTDGLLPPLTVLAVAGVALCLRYRRAGVVLLAFALPYYALLCATYVRFDRNLLPLLPFLALCAAASAEAMVPRLAALLRNHPAAYALVLGVAVAPPLYAASRADFAITHPFSEQVAVAWANAHLPRRAALATENWEGLSFSARRYRITHLGALAWQPYNWLLARGVRYVVADSWTDGAYLSDPRRYPLEAARYRELYRRGRLLTRIAADPILRPGPTMSIYELPRPHAASRLHASTTLFTMTPQCASAHDTNRYRAPCGAGHGSPAR
jgi:4-amino-4-deoxy-L-arabinose transferase-like glycosyltransferase